MSQPTMPNLQAITAGFPGRCQTCRKRVAPGDLVWWARGAGTRCDPCQRRVAEELAAPMLTDEARARINDFARRYGPSGKFNRRLAEAQLAEAQLAEAAEAQADTEYDAHVNR